MTKFFKTITTVLPLGIALVVASSAPMSSIAYADDETTVTTDTTAPSSNEDTPKPTVCVGPSEVELNPTDPVVEVEEQPQIEPQIYAMSAAGAPQIHRGTKQLQREFSRSASVSEAEKSNSRAANLLDWFKQKKKAHKL